MSWLLDALSAPGDYTRGLLAGRPGERVGARQLMSGYGLADEGDDSLMGTVRDMGVGMLTDPLTYAGGALARGAGMAAGGLGKLAGLRRGFSMAHGVDDAGRAASVLGGAPAQQELARMTASALPEMYQGGTHGLYLGAGQVGEMLGQQVPGGVGAVMKAAVPGAARHETMHGLIDAAAQSGSSAGLGPLARAAAWARSGGSETGPRAGLGRLLDETAAHAAEGRGFMEQAGNAGRFLFGPGDRAYYAGYIRKASPLIASLYESLPYAPAGAGMLGGAGLGTMLGLASRGE